MALMCYMHFQKQIQMITISQQLVTPISISCLSLGTAGLKIHKVLISLAFQDKHSYVAKKRSISYLFIKKKVLNIELFLLAMI